MIGLGKALFQMLVDRAGYQKEAASDLEHLEEQALIMLPMLAVSVEGVVLAMSKVMEKSETLAIGTAKVL